MTIKWLPLIKNVSVTGKIIRTSLALEFINDYSKLVGMHVALSEAVAPYTEVYAFGFKNSPCNRTYCTLPHFQVGHI